MKVRCCRHLYCYRRHLYCYRRRRHHHHHHTTTTTTNNNNNNRTSYWRLKLTLLFVTVFLKGRTYVLYTSNLPTF
jgi:hypothetical protein